LENYSKINVFPNLLTDILYSLEEYRANMGVVFDPLNVQGTLKPD